MFRLACCLLMASVAQATTPMFQASFRAPNHDWTVVRGSALLDPSVLDDNSTSLRVERDTVSQDACVRLALATLTLGKRYELCGWVRTEALVVGDLDRSPIASGAALTMPFDVHSVSIGGMQPWTRVTLRFVASRVQDQVLLTVGNGGSFSGRTWFEGIRLDEVSSDDEWPAREAVQTFGPAYR